MSEDMRTYPTGCERHTKDAARIAELEQAVRVLAKSIYDEPELPGDMPDEMWNMLNGNRNMTRLALVRVVQETKRGILERATANHIAREAIKAIEKARVN